MALSTLPGSAGALVPPQYLGQHTHEIKGGGIEAHEHGESNPGHSHTPSDPDNPTGKSLLATDDNKSEAYWEAKRNYSDEQRAEYAKSGVALGDGSYPIPDKGALDDAVSSFGHNPTDAVKAHIIKRAQALGATSMLPDGWAEKGTTSIEVKGFTLDWEIKSVVEDADAPGTLVLDGYANTWAKDRDGETFAKTAFDSAIQEYMLNPVVLYNHKDDRQIGFIESVTPDHLGIRVKAKIPPPPPGTEPWHTKAYNDIKTKVLRAMSVGGVFVRNPSIKSQIDRIKWYETSVVPVPANQFSIFAVAESKGLHFPEEEVDVPEWVRDGKTGPKYSFPGGAKMDGKALAYDKLPDGMEQCKTCDGTGKIRGGNVNCPDCGTKGYMESGGQGVNSGGKSTEGGKMEGKSATVPIEEFESLQKQVAALTADRDEFVLEQKAQAEAEKRLENEIKAAKEASESEKSQTEKFEAIVQKAMGNLRSTKKFAFAAPGARRDPEEAKGLGEWLRDCRDAKRGDFDAYKRLQVTHSESIEEYGLKALSGTLGGAGGGYLVPPQYWQQGLAEFRIAAAKVRPLCTPIPNVISNQVLIPRETGVSAVGWIAENSAKPSTDQTFGQIAVNLFVLGGISKVSNQLLDDSSPAVDTIVRKDLGRTIGRAEDLAFLNGNGNGQPVGVLQTTGVLTVGYSAPSVGSGLADAISQAILAIETNFFGDPTAIVAHPRTVAGLRQVKDSQGRYIFEGGWAPGLTPQAGGMVSFLGADAQAATPVGSVWGLPVISDANIPTTFSGTTPTGGSESPIIVADWTEAYILDRQGLTVDVSNEAGTSFEQNQTWFRGEERVGFTAARQPTAFCYVTGVTSSAA